MYITKENKYDVQLNYLIFLSEYYDPRMNKLSKLYFLIKSFKLMATPLKEVSREESSSSFSSSFDLSSYKGTVSS